MKTFIKSIIAITLILSCTYSSFGQGQVYDVVSIGPGYANQSFYSLANGEVSNTSNTNWDLAFQIAGFQASILVNSKNNVRLFRSGLDINAWSNITANDTIGKLNPGNELFNQDTSWWAGAFNITNDVSNQFDLGWGVYDFATHVVSGDSLFFIKLSTGVVKKIWIQALQNGIYYFAYADVDGSNEVNATLNKQNFAGKNFGYYSIINGATIDREPNKYSWDLTFMQYMATTPFIYKVTGVITNDSVSSVKTYPVDVNTVTPWGAPFSYHTSNIGYEWKAFDLNINAWTIEDSVVYFVYGRPGGLWKLVFTGFGGAATGNFEFYKEQISSTGINENGGFPALLNLYPNPAATFTKVTLFIDRTDPSNSAGIYDLSGKRVSEIQLPVAPGLQEIFVNTSNLKAGIYFVRVIVDGITTSRKLIVTG